VYYALPGRKVTSNFAGRAISAGERREIRSLQRGEITAVACDQGREWLSSAVAQIATYVAMIADRFDHKEVAVPLKNGANFQSDTGLVNARPQLADAQAGMNMGPAKSARQTSEFGEYFRLCVRSEFGQSG
jgi:hypothetical protein